MYIEVYIPYIKFKLNLCLCLCLWTCAYESMRRMYDHALNPLLASPFASKKCFAYRSTIISFSSVTTLLRSSLVASPTVSFMYIHYTCMYTLHIWNWQTEKIINEILRSNGFNWIWLLRRVFTGTISCKRKKYNRFSLGLSEWKCVYYLNTSLPYHQHILTTINYRVPAGYWLHVFTQSHIQPDQNETTKWSNQNDMNEVVLVCVTSKRKRFIWSECRNTNEFEEILILHIVDLVNCIFAECFFLFFFALRCLLHISNFDQIMAVVLEKTLSSVTV